MKINLLDHGYVEYISHMGDDLTVVNAARVSFHKTSEWMDDNGNKSLMEKDERLIGYLARNQHWTPFAHPQITLRIKAPIFVRAQLGKHQVGFVMNEVSRRYVTETPQLYVPKWRSAPKDGAKQGSHEFMDPNPYVSDMYENLCDDALEVYEDLLKQGVAPEQARAVLPQAMYTEWWWTGSLAGYARVYKQRSENHAQWEVREFANAIAKLIKPLYPVSWKALTL